MLVFTVIVEGTICNFYCCFTWLLMVWKSAIDFFRVNFLYSYILKLLLILIACDYVAFFFPFLVYVIVFSVNIDRVIS